MQISESKGSCLCGQVSYKFEGPAKVFQYCHCSRCQKFTGSAHAANIIVDPSQFAWLSGEQQVGRYEVPDAKHFATSFCKNCGSSLPWMTKSKMSMVIPAGTLDDDPMEKPKHNIFYADKAPWFVNVESLVKYDKFPLKK